MAEVDGMTLLMAVQAVDEVIGRLRDATVDEDAADPNDQILLMDFQRAARSLERAYDEACKVELDLPPYDELVRNH